MSQDTVISARGLGKRYHRGTAIVQHDQLREAIRDGMLTLFKRERRHSADDTFWALKDVSFDIKHGENVGIIGLNGAGKSTLLKILSRIVTPTAGTARITGRLGALLEVGTGFHHELTGRENMFLYGTILGMTRKEVARKFDAIVDFAEIEDFLDTPVKRFSSGMYIRLAFAIAAHLDPDILLLDEVLAVGDFTFQRKCMTFARQLEQKGSTILFVSHNAFNIKTMCPRVIYLKGGRVVFDGPTEEGLRLYEGDSRLAPTTTIQAEDGAPSILITDVTLMDEQGRAKATFDHGERMRIRMRYEAAEPIDEANFSVSVSRSDQVLCCNYSTVTDHVELPSLSGEGYIELTTPPLKLVADQYTLSIVVRQRGFHRVLAAQTGANFNMTHSLLAPTMFGVFHERGNWRHEASADVRQQRVYKLSG